MKKIFIFTTLVLPVALGLTPSLVRAQDVSGATVKPAIIEEQVLRGQVLTKKFSLTNNNPLTKTFYLHVRDVKDVGPGGNPLFADEGEITEFELSSWVSLAQTSISIASGKSVEIPFTIRVPVNATPGAHLGFLFADLRGERPSGTGSGVGFAVGTMLNLRIAGQTIDEAQLREFRTDKLIYTKPQVTFTTTILNVGNTLIRPIGTIAIRDMFGKQVANVLVNESKSAIIPAGRRELETKWQSDSFAFGRYSAELGLSFGEGFEGRKTLSESTTFWLLPSSVVLPLLAFLIAASIFAYVSARIYVRRQLRHLHGKGTLRRQQQHMSLVTIFTVSTLIFSILFLFVLVAMYAL